MFDTGKNNINNEIKYLFSYFFFMNSFRIKGIYINGKYGWKWKSIAASYYEIKSG